MGTAFANDPMDVATPLEAEGCGTEEPKPLPTTTEGPMSIFNDEIRRFRFEIEDMLITNEVAQAFMVRYSDSTNPDIIGAYADTKTNTLVVVGPPEAEPAIRKSLAVWMVATTDLVNPSLEVQKRQLLDERKTLLEEMANVEIGLVDAAERKGEQAAKELQARLESFEKELQITERKIEVVNKYLKRLDEVKE
jgi:hypothetical protein